MHEDRFKYYLLRGNLRALQQQMSHAKSDFKKAIDHAKDPQEALPARYLYAGLCEGQGRLNEAIDEYLRISDYDEKNPVVFLKLAELYEKQKASLLLYRLWKGAEEIEVLKILRKFLQDII